MSEEQTVFTPFKRGAIVRHEDIGPNALVVRDLGHKDVVVVQCESEDDGNLRLRGFPRDELVQVLPSSGDLDKEFDLRWAADMRAIKLWQKAHPGSDLIWPDHTDLVLWLMDQIDMTTHK